MQVAKTCRISSSGDLLVGDLFGNTINMIRAKNKQAYEGTYRAADGMDAAMKVTVVDVHDTARGQTHTELTCESFILLSVTVTILACNS
eukprot:1161879-Pelagomonas_calceolata.AAC.5